MGKMNKPVMPEYSGDYDEDVTAIAGIMWNAWKKDPEFDLTYQSVRFVSEGTYLLMREKWEKLRDTRDPSLDRILPPDYKGAWRRLGLHNQNVDVHEWAMGEWEAAYE